MKRALLFCISLSIGIGLLVWIIRIVGWQEIKPPFLFFTGWQGIIIVLLSFLILLVGTWKWRMVLKSQGYDLSLRQLLGPYLTCFAMNYLFQTILVGGEIFRLYVLKEKYSVPWKKAVVSIAIDKILEITAFLIALLIGLAFFLFKIGLPPKNLGLILGGFLLFLISGIGFFYFKSFRKESIAKPIAKLLSRRGLPNGDIVEIERDVFHYFRFQKLAFWQGLGSALLMAASSWLRCWVLLICLVKSIAFLPSIAIFSFFYIARLIPIPADLGVSEAIQVFAFNALGLGTGMAPAFAIIIRGGELVMILLGAIFFFKFGIDLLQIFLFKKIDRLIKTNNNNNQD